MQPIHAYFKEAITKNASDVHLVGGDKPLLRIEGELSEIAPETLDPKELETAIFGLMNKEQVATYRDERELDFGIEIEGVRFRVNVHQEMGNIGLAARLIPSEIPSPEELHFEPALLEFTKLLNGLVLVTGPTGSGKSTTIAAMIQEINKNRKAHIISIEDPIEFVFKNNQSLIEQREVGSDTPSFASALKHILRQDPNVIYVGEMRDAETISTVLTAAETGHLVFSTLHTASAAETIERIVDVFEGGRQKEVLIQLAGALRGVIAQELVMGKDGKRVPAREVFINTPAVANLIRENNSPQIKTAIQTGAKDGMISLENSLKELVKEGWIDETTAQNRMGRAKKV